MQKIEHWKDHLTRTINEHRELPFTWGTHDCFQWVATCIKETTDFDVAEKSRGMYFTAIQSYKVLKRVYGTDSLLEVLPKFGFEEQHIALAKFGDVVYKKSNFEGFDCALGICYGKVSFFVGDENQGLVSVDTLSLDGSFRV